MPALPLNVTVRWAIATIAVISLVCIIVQLSEGHSQCLEDLHVQQAIVTRLERRVSELESERTAHENSRETERRKVKRWLERVAIPRDAALRIARADAAKGHRNPDEGLAIYDMEASLEI